MIEKVLLVTTIFLALISMLGNKSKYSIYFSMTSILILMFIALSKTRLEMTFVFLLTFIVFETVCFTQKTWEFRKFKQIKISRHKLYWITLCLTIGVSAVWMTSMNLGNFSLSQLEMDGELIKLLLPLTFCLYGLLRNKKNARV